MNVLIVDDEYFACAALEKLVKDYFKEQNLPLICNVFYNSKEAFEHLNHQEVDLVMTDIRMSEMDGLELALKIQGMNQDTQTVVISGYAEFAYAQAALKYEVVDYLLKPISRKQIYECLETCVERYQKLVEARRIIINEKKQTIFHQITSGTDITAEQLLEETEKGKYNQVVMSMVHCRENFLSEFKEYAGEMEDLRGVRCLACENTKGSVALYIYYCAASETDNLRERIIKHNYMCCKSIRNETNTIYLSVSSMQVTTIHLYELYSQTKYAMNDKLLQPESYFFDYCKIMENKEYDSVGASLIEYELKQSFEFKDKTLTKKLIYQQIKNVAEKTHPSLPQLSNTISLLVLAVNKIIHAYNYKTKKEVEDIANISLSEFMNLEELQNYFVLHIDRLYEEMFAEEIVQNVVEKLLGYVAEHYYLNISLSDISKNELFLNQSYVSRVFKAQMGISFSRYLLNYRLEKAMECICNDTDVTVQEVATLTGFYDCSYFVKQFKKQYGETPGYYQKCSRKTKEDLCDTK